MLRLDQRYFYTLNGLFFGLFFLLALTGYYLLRSIEIANHKTMLHHLIAQYHLTDSPWAQHSARLDSLHWQTGVRITLVERNGTVLYESNRTPVGMENLLHRPEIVRAHTHGWGSIMRYSRTLKRTMLYLAKATPTGYVRMAYPMRAIRSKFVRFWLQALPIFTVALGLAYWLTLHISRSVSNDVRRINDGLDHLLAKRYDRAAPPVACCQELHTISKQIARIATKLEKRDRQKSKYTKRLKRLTRRQSEIISAISHEFKNPVAAIIGYAQTIQDDPDLPPGLRQKFLTKIIQNGERISDLIDRLALAIKMDTHTLTLDKKPFDMALLIEEAVDAQRKKYPNRTLQIETESTEVVGDRMLFWYAVSNLIDNALKYSDATVVVRLHAGHFAVTDRGAGIPPHLQKKITQRFFRASSHAWDNSLGVGLFIVTYILRLHGLALQIESLPGSGSTFGFDLDAIRADDMHNA